MIAVAQSGSAFIFRIFLKVVGKFDAHINVG